MNGQMRHYYKTRSRLIALLGAKCKICNSTEELQFDHIDPNTKEFDIASKTRSYAYHKLEREAEKCQLLCRSCHLDKTKGEAGYLKRWTNKPKLIHGTVNTYRKHKCRCGICIRGYYFERSKEYHNGPVAKLGKAAPLQGAD